MIVGIGVDIIAVARMERELARDPEGFAAQLFTAGERAACASRESPGRRFAELFAAKEALLKALAIEPLDTGAYREVEIVRRGPDPAGFVLHGRMHERAAARGAGRIRLSLASNPDVASAFVVVEATSPSPSPSGGP